MAGSVPFGKGLELGRISGRSNAGKLEASRASGAFHEGREFRIVAMIHRVQVILILDGLTPWSISALSFLHVQIHSTGNRGCLPVCRNPPRWPADIYGSGLRSRRRAASCFLSP